MHDEVGNDVSSGPSFGTMILFLQKRSNQPMKPPAPLQNDLSVFATIPCRGLSLSR
jgi:hypothetical protein